MSLKNTREDEITTHDEETHPAIKLRLLGELDGLVDLNDVEAVIIDEGFMFEDVEDTVSSVKRWRKSGIDVIVASLDVMANGSMPRAVVGLLALDPDETEYKLAACTVRRSPECDAKRAEYTMIFDAEGNLIPREQLVDVLPQEREDSKEEPERDYKAACKACYYGYGL